VPEEQHHQAHNEDIGSKRDPLATGLRETIIDEVYRNFPLLTVNDISSKKRHPHEQKNGQREYPNERIVKEPPQEDINDVGEKHDSKAKNCNHLADLFPFRKYFLDHLEIPFLLLRFLPTSPPGEGGEVHPGGTQVLVPGAGSPF
jgi:hypothetical protein